MGFGSWQPWQDTPNPQLCDGAHVACTRYFDEAALACLACAVRGESLVETRCPLLQSTYVYRRFDRACNTSEGMLGAEEGAGKAIEAPPLFNNAVLGLYMATLDRGVVVEGKRGCVNPGGFSRSSRCRSNSQQQLRHTNQHTKQQPLRVWSILPRTSSQIHSFSSAIHRGCLFGTRGIGVPSSREREPPASELARALGVRAWRPTRSGDFGGGGRRGRRLATAEGR